MIIIAIDCGASFLKGARFSSNRLENVLQLDAPSTKKTTDIFKISQIDVLTESVRKMICELAHSGEEITLCISNEMHGFILSESDGKPYTDYISWQNELGNILIDGKSSAEMLRKEISDIDVLNTGMPLRGGLPSCNLLYLKRKGLLTGNLHFYTLGDYIIRRLSGSEPAAHPTNAAATGLFDLRTNDWNRKLIDFVADDGMIFPKVSFECTLFKINGISVRALPAIGDQQAALLGAGVKPGDISFNLGTGAQVSTVVDEPVCGTDYQIRPFFDGKFLKTVPHIPSGRALNVYFRFVKSILDRYGCTCDSSEIYSGMLKAAESADEVGLVCDMSFFENAVTNNIMGSINNIPESGFTFGNLMKSVFDQLADNFIYIAKRLEPDLTKPERVVFSGGLARKIECIRRRITEEYPNKPVSISDNETLEGLKKYALERDK